MFCFFYKIIFGNPVEAEDFWYEIPKWMKNAIFAKNVVEMNKTEFFLRVKSFLFHSVNFLWEIYVGLQWKKKGDIYIQTKRHIPSQFTDPRHTSSST